MRKRLESEPLNWHRHTYHLVIHLLYIGYLTVCVREGDDSKQNYV